MLVKNLMNRDISFMYETEDKLGNPKFEIVNIVAGWTVDIKQEVWEKIEKQTKTIRAFEEEELEIAGVLVNNIMTGEKTPATKIRRMATGETKEVNLVRYLTKHREIELVEGEEVEMPSREMMARFLKRYNFEVKPQHKDETLLAEIEKIKEELAAFQI